MAIPGEITGFTLASARGGRDGVIVVFDVAGANGAIQQTQTMWLPVPVARDLVEKMSMSLADLE